MHLFLDIDGVMVPANSWKHPEVLGDGFFAFSHEAVRTLSEMLVEGGHIILTSSHRNRYSAEVWKSIFLKRGLMVSGFSLLPQSPVGTSRLSEILNWFNNNAEPAHFAILDDDKSLNALPPRIKRGLIQTAPLIGLRREHLNSYLEITEKLIPSL